jgi:hypothetical protein
MNDLGPLHHFLGLEVHATSKEIFLNQRKYTTNHILFAGFVDATPVDAPMEINLKLRKEEGDLLCKLYSLPQVCWELGLHD